MSVVSVILPEFLELRPAVQSALWSEWCPSLYRAWVRVGLSAIGPAGTVLTLILIGSGSGGCSLSRTDGAFARMEDGDATGSVRPLAEKPPTDSDLAFARNAASDVLTKGGKDFSQPWENPETGARGSVTPIAAAYSSDGRTCRDFLASYVNGRSESWLQGGACKSDHGQWEIHTLKPWKRG
jgi:17 kDa outer membrane surface antigen